MNKIFKSRVFIIIICAIVFTSIGVIAANTISASSISYGNGTVEDAIDDLYQKVAFPQIISADCVSASVVCDGDCNTNVGKQLVNFKPSYFIIHTQGTTGILYYNKNVSSSVWTIYPQSSWSEYKAPNFGNYFVIDDNGLFLKNLSNTHGTLDYVACK